MSSLDELHEELDDLRTRVSVLEFDVNGVREIWSSARSAARAADRHLTTARSEWLQVVTEVGAGLSQIVSLLSSPEACLPARRPENTQSARDSPLT
jgi:hypothetical protein